MASMTRGRSKIYDHHRRGCDHLEKERGKEEKGEMIQREKGIKFNALCCVSFLLLSLLFASKEEILKKADE